MSAAIVDLPAPDGPTSATVMPGRMSRSMSCSTRGGPPSGSASGAPVSSERIVPSLAPG